MSELRADIEELKRMLKVERRNNDSFQRFVGFMFGVIVTLLIWTLWVVS